VAVFAVAAWVGFAAAAKLAPGHLRARIERELGDSLGAPVSLARVEIRLAQGLLIEARDGVAGPFPDGSTLRSPSARARVDLLSLLLGRLELRRLLLADASLALGGAGPEVMDLDYLSGQGVRICLQGHQPFMAAVRAVHETLKALRAGTPPAELAGLAPAELMKQVTRDQDYRRWMEDFLGGR